MWHSVRVASDSDLESRHYDRCENAPKTRTDKISLTVGWQGIGTKETKADPLGRRGVENAHKSVTIHAVLEYQDRYSGHNDVSSRENLCIDLGELIEAVCFEEVVLSQNTNSSSLQGESRDETTATTKVVREAYKHLQSDGLYPGNLPKFLERCYLFALDVHHQSNTFPMSLQWEFDTRRGVGHDLSRRPWTYVQPYHPDMHERESEHFKNPPIVPVSGNEPCALVDEETPLTPPELGRHVRMALREPLEQLLSAMYEGKHLRVRKRDAKRNETKLYRYLRDLCDYYWACSRFAMYNLTATNERFRERTNHRERCDDVIWMMSEDLLRNAWRFAYGPLPEDKKDLRSYLSADMGVGKIRVKVSTFDPDVRENDRALSLAHSVQRTARLYVRISVLVLVEDFPRDANR